MAPVDPETLFQRASSYTGQAIIGVRPEQWDMPTECPDWNVRALVNHIVLGNRMGLEFMNGRLQTMEEVVRFREESAVGDDPLAAYDTATKALAEAFGQPGAMDRMINVPYMPQPIPGAMFAGQRATEMLVHGWDLARSTGQDDTLDPELCAIVYADLKPLEQMLRSSGQFGEHVDVPDDADAQTKMLALLGRKR